MLPIALLVGRKADSWGRKPLFLAGFAILPIRAVLYTFSDNSFWLIGVQLLDGVGAGIFGALTPLVIADIMRGTGRYNLAAAGDRHRPGHRRLAERAGGRRDRRSFRLQRRVSGRRRRRGRRIHRVRPSDAGNRRTGNLGITYGGCAERLKRGPGAAGPHLIRPGQPSIGQARGRGRGCAIARRIRPAVRNTDTRRES